MTSSKRLWSLWDMLKLNASAFFKAISTLRYAQSAVQVMKDTGHGPVKSEEKMIKGIAKTTIQLLDELQQSLLILNTKITAMSVDRLKARLVLHVVDEDEKGIVTYGEFADSMKDIDLRLKDELSHTKVFVLESGRENFFDPKEPLFGAGVVDKFPKAIDDIEDTGKCLALGLGTSAVMHLMRVMEVGLQDLAKSLGIPYAPSWESYLSQIQAKISTKHKRKGVRWKRDEKFYRDLSGDLLTVKQAWRNPTMHIDRRYNVDEAETIFNAVKALMQRLATKCST